jgi:hypothetical protein
VGVGVEAAGRGSSKCGRLTHSEAEGEKNALGFDVRTVFVIRTHSNLNSNKILTLTLGSEESSLYRYYRYRVERELYLSSLAILDYTLLS